MCKQSFLPFALASAFAFALAFLFLLLIFDACLPDSLGLAGRSRRMGVMRHRHELPRPVKGISEATLDRPRGRETIALLT